MRRRYIQMKFHNGCWLFKEGYGCFSPQHVYEVRKNTDEVVLCAPTSRIMHKGDTLGGINLTVRITAPMPEVIRVQTYHHKGVVDRGPKFELNLPETGKLDVEETEATLTVRSGHLALVIDKENWSMRYERDGRLLTKSGAKDLSYIKTDWKGFAYDRGEDDAYMCQQLGLSVGELIYGLGEKFTPFQQRIGRVRRLVQHSFVELQPGILPVYVNIPYKLLFGLFGRVFFHSCSVSLCIFHFSSVLFLSGTRRIIFFSIPKVHHTVGSVPSLSVYCPGSLKKFP